MKLPFNIPAKPALKLPKLSALKAGKMDPRATKAALAAATAAAAIGIGAFVQSGTPLEASAVQPPKPKVIASNLVATPARAVAELPAQDPERSLPLPPNDQYAEATLPAQPIILAVARDLPTAQMPKEENAPLLGCSHDVSVTPAVAAMANLSVQASCFPNSRVVVQHAGLIFSEILDDDGVLEISVPVMEQAAEFEVKFENGRNETVSIDVPSIQFYDRVAVQWMGETGLQIHALEFGASYGDDGHVWFGNERDLTAVIGGNGGFLMRMGDGQSEISRMADVYTFPSGNATTAGDVVLSVEAEVNGSNCGRDIAASTLQVSPTQAASRRDFQIAMPECAASGDFLVLKNLLADLTIAVR